MKLIVLALVGLSAVALAAPSELVPTDLIDAASVPGGTAENFDVEIKAKKGKKHHKKGKRFRTASNDVLADFEDVDAFEKRDVEELFTSLEEAEADVLINAKKGKKRHRKGKKHARINDNELVEIIDGGGIEKREEGIEFGLETEDIDVNVNAKKGKKRHRKGKKHARVATDELDFEES